MGGDENGVRISEIIEAASRRRTQPLSGSKRHTGSAACSGDPPGRFIDRLDQRQRTARAGRPVKAPRPRRVQEVDVGGGADAVAPNTPKQEPSRSYESRLSISPFSGLIMQSPIPLYRTNMNRPVPNRTPHRLWRFHS